MELGQVVQVGRGDSEVQGESCDGVTGLGKNGGCGVGTGGYGGGVGGHGSGGVGASSG